MTTAALTSNITMPATLPRNQKLDQSKGDISRKMSKPIKPSRVSKKSSPQGLSSSSSTLITSIATHTHDDIEDMEQPLALIAASSRTPFEKRVWTALCHIPRGQFTTYGLLAEHLGSSPRAVGNALRRNPFAPDVPCHRVVATGGTLGGFKGKWPRDGEGITLDEKRSLLRSEGVRFEGKGRVLGTPWAFAKKVKVAV